MKAKTMPIAKKTGKQWKLQRSGNPYPSPPPVCKNKPNLNIYLTFINPDKAKTYNENTNKY